MRYRLPDQVFFNGFLIAVAAKGVLQLSLHALGNRAGAAEIPLALLRHASLQVARARLAVFRMAFGGQAEPLFGAFVGLLLGHRLFLSHS